MGTLAGTLSKEQEQVLELVKQGKNVFMTGPGGTGKTYLIQKIVEMNPHKITRVTALTGCAAELLGGDASTIHRFSGTGITSGTKQRVINRVLKKKKYVAAWLKIHILIVDEVSMLCVKFFEILDSLGKTIRMNDLPFGGIQVIFSGDFHQLPPVGDEDEPDTCKFCFQSKRWSDTFKDTVVLKHIFRQSDPVFMKVLRQVRRGAISKQTYEILKKRLMIKENRKELAYGKTLDPPLILPLRNTVKTINDMNMKKLDSSVITYEYEIITTKDYEPPYKPDSYDIDEKYIEYETNQLKKRMNGELILDLKLGAKVMCVANIGMEGSNKIVNGSQGEIIDFVDNIPIVKFKNGIIKEMTPHTWMSDDIKGLGLKQIPLILSWAISIHKAQGITLDSAIIDIGDNIFEYGQTYVALSRIKTLEGLFLGEFNMLRIMTNPIVTEYYASL